MKYTVIAVIFAGVLISAAILLSGKDGASTYPADSKNVSIVNGKQVIEITAKGGYFPRQSSAQANIPTILKLATTGTFDCSSAIRIPSLNYSANLKPSGVTEIEIPAQQAGSTIQGLCAMGMYNFTISFN